MRKLLKHKVQSRRTQAAIIVLGVVIVGTAVWLAARGASAGAFEAENGVVSGQASRIAVPGASKGVAVQFNENEFSFAAIPDTQQEVINDTNLASLLVPGTSIHMNQYFNQRLQWLVDHRAEYNLKYVWQVGDLQNWDTPNHDQYVRASNGLKILENAGIPYSIANGNHDNLATGVGGSARDPATTTTDLRVVDTWNSYYPTSRYPGMHTLCQEFAQFDARLMAAVPAGMASTNVNHPQTVKNECAKPNYSTVNAYRTFTAGGLNWIIITFELWPRQAIQEWMKTVLERYPNYNAILVTHHYIDGGGAISTSFGGYGSPQGAPSAVFNNVIKNYANVKIVSNGHISNNADCSTSTGVNGNTIMNYLNDRLDGNDTPNYFRLIKINVSARTITSQHVMPNPAEAARVPANPAKCNESNVTWAR